MTLRDRLAALVDAVPPGGSVTLPRDWLAQVLAAENGAPESRIRDERTPALPGIPPVATTGLLKVDEAAKLLNVDERWLYRHAKALPFTRRLGPKTLRFDADGLAKWAARRVA